jgi:hypothetical protein
MPKVILVSKNSYKLLTVLVSFLSLSIVSFTAQILLSLGWINQIPIGNTKRRMASIIHSENFAFLLNSRDFKDFGT